MRILEGSSNNNILTYDIQLFATFKVIYSRQGIDLRDTCALYLFVGYYFKDCLAWQSLCDSNIHNVFNLHVQQVSSIISLPLLLMYAVVFVSFEEMHVPSCP